MVAPVIAKGPDRDGIWRTKDLDNPLQTLGSKLVAWWRADVTTVVLGKATAATDLSGNGNNATSTPGEQLGFTVSGSMGRAAWVADGTPQSLFANLVAPLAIDTKATIMAVGKADVAAADFAELAALSDGAALVALSTGIAKPVGGFALLANVTGAGGFSGFIQPTFDTNGHLATLIAQTGNSAGYLDGKGIHALALSPGGTASLGSHFFVGSNTAEAVTPWKGEIYECLLTNAQPTGPELAQLNEYFATRYQPFLQISE